MKILDFDFDTNHGFAWIIVDSKNEGEQLTVQCCLKTGDYDAERDCGKSIQFLQEIVQGDCGHNDGICGDVNAQAFKYWGENRCMTALFNKAKVAGLILSN